MTADLLIIVILVGAIAAFSLWKGKPGAVTLVLSSYAAAYVFVALELGSKAAKLIGGTTNDGYARLAALAIAIGVFYAAIGTRSSGFFGFGFTEKIVQVLIFSIVTAGFLLSFIFAYVTLGDTYQFGKVAKGLFSGDLPFLIWSLAPAATLFFYRHE